MRPRLASVGKHVGAQIAVGLHSLFGSRSENAFGILMYHRVSHVRPGDAEPTWNVTPERFRAQMEGLLARGYRVWPLQSVIQHARDGTTIPAKTAVVTFDDGYRNVYRNAWPVLKELNIPATIFVATAFVDTTSVVPFDRWGMRWHAQTPPEVWQTVTWAQCREMESSGVVEIGSHSHTHVDFRGRVENMRDDLLISLTILREQLGRSEFTFSFPYGGRRLGYAGEALMNVARESGALCALTTETELANPASGPFGWGRLEAVQGDDASTIAAKLEGWYNWMGSARAVFRAFAPPRAGVAAPGVGR